MFSAADHAFMSHALRLAEKGLHSTTPNPRVGCVIVRDEQIVGSGWHEKAGQPHAEINALVDAGAAARGATVYVTLEPCSHHGRTPPCADALITAGIARVVIAMEDPNPLSGCGCALLQQAGITVQTGLLQAEASTLNAGFISRMTRKKPWVRLKIAASLDGKTALNNGVSQWITAEAARQDGHRWRARSCAVMTGIGTVESDNPQLTVRHIKTDRQPKKIVVDGRLAIPLDSRLLQNGEETYIFTAQTGNPEKKAALNQLNARVMVLPDVGGRVDLQKMMTTLADLEINEVLVEAGGRLNGALVDAGLVDELIIYLAPHLIGNDAQGMIALPELADLEDKKPLKIQDIRMIGQDIRLIARFQ